MEGAIIKGKGSAGCKL